MSSKLEQLQVLLDENSRARKLLIAVDSVFRIDEEELLKMTGIASQQDRDLPNQLEALGAIMIATQAETRIRSRYRYFRLNPLVKVRVVVSDL